MAVVVCYIHRSTFISLAFLLDCQRLNILLQYLHVLVMGCVGSVVDLELAHRLFAVLGAQEFIEIGGFGSVARKCEYKLVLRAGENVLFVQKSVFFLCAEKCFFVLLGK